MKPLLVLAAMIAASLAPTLVQAKGYGALFGHRAFVNIQMIEEFNQTFVGTPSSEVHEDQLGRYVCEEYASTKDQLHFTQAPEVYSRILESPFYLRIGSGEKPSAAWGARDTLPQVIEGLPILVRESTNWLGQTDQEVLFWYEESFRDVRPIYGLNQVSRESREMRILDNGTLLIRTLHRDHPTRIAWYERELPELLAYNEENERQEFIHHFLKCSQLK